MISVEEALARVLDSVEVLDEEESPILDSLGRVLAEDITAPFDVPPRDNSAMDGYAVRAADTREASRERPRVLRVVDRVAAGAASGCRVEAGTAVRIMTGGPLPEGADSIVRFEGTDEALRSGPAAEIGIMTEVKPGWDVRYAGEDIARGSRVLKRGLVISPAEVGVLASLGRQTVKVIRRPRVAVLATGNELVNLGQPLDEGKIYNSNSYSLAALVSYYGAIPEILDVVRDSEDSLVARLREGISADMLLTSGGVSMGDYDVVKDVLAKQGKVSFWTVRMRPGKPVAFGMIKGVSKSGAEIKIPHLGLPGNPVSVMVTFELFARPALLKMMGRKDLARPLIEAVIEEDVVNTDGRRIFARAVVSQREGQYFARLTGPQGSGVLTSMTLANGLAIIPEDSAGVAAGDKVRVMMLDWRKKDLALAST
ncbi:MAG: molybdopterin molybdotransferase MoeA [Dehalococcoidales bacterium]|nr:molybdopterin molybdotransferase MoeA [Dehalococcoidales bacterium]